ncbi:molecular chaperone [Serratia marcescens]|uniref:fimbria/pilus periplasmic chaperone n=1 Tax=Serratia marcescens TaxID=615 RepID=UPI000F7F112A|nr:fimbria/pilus periplasmic chaperone [Serratia marcescens]RTF19078.1 molecular chaperone [Serratia marcescens]
MNKHPITLLTAAGLALSAVLPTADAAISLDRTRAVYVSDAKSISLNIVNENKELPFLAQSWLENEQHQKITSPLVVLPPLQRVEPSERSVVRITKTPEADRLPQDRESVFYFNLREIPPKSNKPNSLQIALQTRIKLFYRPAAIAPERNTAPWQEQLTLTKQGDRYIVNNPTPYYVTIIDVASRKNASGPQNFEPFMVPPKGQAALTVNAASVGSSPVLTYINDYGGRPQLSFSCNGDSCSVVPEKKTS